MPGKGRPFQKGQVANPRGRPPLAHEFRSKCLTATWEKVFPAWMDEMEERERTVMTPDGPVTLVCKGQNWLRCAELLAAYGAGRPGTAEVPAERPTEKPAGIEVDLSNLRVH